MIAEIVNQVLGTWSQLSIKQINQNTLVYYKVAYRQHTRQYMDFASIYCNRSTNKINKSFLMIPFRMVTKLYLILLDSKSVCNCGGPLIMWN